MNGAAACGARPESALRIVAAALTVAFVALLTFVPLGSNDFWLQARIGQMILEDHAIPRTVLFTFTWARDYSFNAHEWLPSIVFHLFDRAFGYERLLFVQGAMGLILFALSFVLAKRLSGSTAIALLLAAMAMLVQNYRHHLRPELFALLLFVSLLLVLSTYREQRNWLVLGWALPIGVTWANSHGSFLVGPVTAFIFAAGEAVEAARPDTFDSWRSRLREAIVAGAPYALTAVALLSTSLLNPRGAELLYFALTLPASEVTKSLVLEWMPTLSPSFMSGRAFPIFVFAAIVTAAIAATCRRRLTATDLLLLIAFGILALRTSRFVVLFGFVSLVVCARLLFDWRRRMPWEQHALTLTACLASVGIGTTLQFGNAYGAFPYHWRTDDFTPPMVARLSRPEVAGNVFNSYEVGAELIYRAWPRLRVSIDSRIDSYGDAYALMHNQLLGDEKMMNEFIKEFDVYYMLLLWRDFESVKGMESLRRSGWGIDIADHKMVLLSRTPNGMVGRAGAGVGVAVDPGASSTGGPKR